MGLDLTGAGAVADLATTVIEKIWPDKSKAEQAQLAAALTIVQGQIEANKVEASSSRLFVSGARPFILWVCGAALTYQYLLCPLLMWITQLTGHPVAKPPVLDDSLFQLMFGMLGLGGLRTVEKIKGVASK